MDTLDDILAHYGVLGMKWGVRRSDKELARARRRRSKVPPSEDAAKAAESLKKAKKGGPKALTNKELQELNQRLNLEQQYNRLTNQKSKLQKGQDRVKMIIGLGKTVNEVVTFAKTPLGVQLAQQLGVKSKKSKEED